MFVGHEKDTKALEREGKDAATHFLSPEIFVTRVKV